MYCITQASLILAVFSAVVSSSVLGKRDTVLDVVLSQAENSVVTATVTNVGGVDLNLLTLGTFLDSAPVEKLAFEDSSVVFTGVLRRVQTTDLAAESFQALAAGASVIIEIDAAAVHDVTSGTYNVAAVGAIPYALGGSTTLSGDAVTFQSNSLSITVSDTTTVARAIPQLSERAKLQSGCSAAQNTATTNALLNCASLAKAASTAATSGSSTKFNEYFKTTSTTTRSVVAARLAAVATECSSATTGKTTYYCTDVYGYCETNVLAYTLPSLNVVVNCPIYYTYLPALTKTCHAQDQATTTLHEMTHAPGVYSPGTQDNGYGYAAATALSSAAAVLNADSYALYANAIYAGC